MYSLYDYDPHEWVEMGESYINDEGETCLIVACVICGTYSYRVLDPETNVYEETFREETGDEDPCD